MTKRLVPYYTFEPSTNTVKVPGNIKAEKLLLITNVTDNKPIYIFSDEFLGMESATYNTTSEETEFVLTFNCNQMSSTDKLQIFYEKDYVNIEPSETYVDAVSKFRVSNPENLIDTDFEYGPQASKWETLQTINNVPSFYSSTSDTTIPFIEKVESVIGSDIINVETGFDHGLTSGLPITVTGLSSVSAEGTYLIQTVPTSTTFSYKARAAQPDSRELQGTYTSIIPGKFFQGSQVALNEAEGILSDFYTLNVTTKSTMVVTLTATAPADFAVGANATLSGNSTGTATIAKVSGTEVTFILDGSFAPVAGDTITATGAGSPGTVSSAATAANKYFIDGAITPDLDLSRKAVYIFDVSDASMNGHGFQLSTVSDGSHAPGGGNTYETYVYTNGTAGTSGAYVRLYVDYQTPSTLYYYCVNHSGMSDDAEMSVDFTTSSKVFLTTESEHGFSDNTNFYFVNTVSPKIFDVQDGTATAPDGKPFISHVDSTSNVISPDITKTDPYNLESTYTLRFDESDIDYGNDRITINGHNLQTGYSVLYYPNPGDQPINGLQRMSVYWVRRINDNQFQLSDSMQGNTSYTRNLSAGGEFIHGKHNLGLVYNIYREYKHYNDWHGYFYMYYWNWRGTYSGHDMNGRTYGLGNQNWDRTVFFSQNRSHAGGYNGSNYYYYNDAWHRFFGTYWRTYGYHHQSLPGGNSSNRWPKNMDMLTDTEHQGYSSNSYSNGYWVGRSTSGASSSPPSANGPAGIGSPYYWTSYIWCDYAYYDYFRITGSNSYWWYYQGYYYFTVDRYFNSVGSHGSQNMFVMMGKQNTTTNDTIYAANHNASTGEQYVLATNSGNIHYYYDSNANRTTINNGTNITVEKIDDNRLRLSGYRLAGVTDNPTLTATIMDPERNSIYVENHSFSNNELLRYDAVGAAAVAGLTTGNSYYVKVLNANRFALKSTIGQSEGDDITDSGTGLQSFENTTASFGTTDGSYTSTIAVGEKKLEVTVPFKIPPALKGFDANSAVNTSRDDITINNHFFANGVRVIYDAQGGTAIGGLTDGKDYYVIVVDNNIFQLAETLADAQNGTEITLTSAPGSSETHQLISASMSGQVSGTGTVTVVSGSRQVVGSSAAFQRFYKIGDTLRVVNPATTPGTIVEKRITAITDDDNLLVDTDFDFSASSLTYLIPSFIYVRPDGFFLHRPFDGGMEIGTSKSPNSRISRQTRKYFRYQSGKGIQTSFAINFIPQIPALSVSYTPSGADSTVAATGDLDGNVLTIADTTGLLVEMDVTGNSSLGAGTRVKRILSATQVEIAPALDSALTGDVTFEQLKLATITTAKPHNLTNELEVRVKDCSIVEYNTTALIHSVPDEFTFRYVLPTIPTNTVGGGFTTVSVVSWSGCSVRAGMFDDQNGFFFEFDGNTLNCVRRSSVQQLPGTISVTNASQIIDGTNTRFVSQISPGDNIVIRGMTHQVIKVHDNNRLTVQPSYRGLTATDVICTKTIDTRAAQSEWNIDKADGNGPSGYILNLDKIQMCYMDFSWYGAGKIRFGFKDQNGHVKYVHEFKHNNRLTESYFRSGNLPARYEVVNGPNPSYVGTLFHWGTSVIMDGTFQDDEAYLFTASGNVQKFTNATSQSASTSQNSFLRSDYTGSWWNRTWYVVVRFSTSDASKFSVGTLVYHASTANNYFLEGRPVDFRSRTTSSYYEAYFQYFEGTQSVFPYNYSSRINSNLGNPAVTSGTTMSIGAPAGVDNIIPSNIPLISIRLAPSVDSSITGSLGQREIINRMALKLDSVGILTTHETEITLILNPQLSTDEFQNVDDPSLCQLVQHKGDDIITGGAKILSFRASGSGNGQTASTEYDLSKLSDLGNSILGGDGIYPNGPDLLTVIANIVDSTDVSINNPYSVSARVTWQESQA